MTVYLYKKKMEYSVYKNNKKIASYTEGGYGKYAKSLAKFCDESGIKLKNYFEIDKENKVVKMIIFSKKHGYKTILFDLSDLDRVMKIRWSVIKNKHKKTHYCKGIISKKPYKNILFHRYILNYNGNLQIDHINRNGLDNRRCNLRIVTQSINQRNSFKKNDIWTNVIKSGSGYQCHWRDMNGNFHKKHFHRYELEDAIKLSIKKRFKYNYILTDKDKKFAKEHHLLLYKKL